MMLPRVLTALCLLGPALPAWAQTPTFRHWYGALQYGRQDYQLFIPGEPETGRTNARRPQLTAGYQFTPRLAVQMGLAPAQERFSYSGSGTNAAGQPTIEEGGSRGHSLAVPVVARYTLVVALWKNLHADLLAGGVLLRSNSQTHFRRVENGIVTTDYQKDHRFFQLYAAAGPSVRYEFSRHIGVFADWLFYKNLQSAPAGIQIVSTGNRSSITNSLMLGARYRFSKD